ncbi:hypothetical protein [Parafilimonas sp.]|uniref:hypothetical protein n=1 Tax=Parafilimonas sp. TaxID=1969739 RepID=UPI0039E2BA77
MLLSYINITIIAEWASFIAAVVLLDKPTGQWRSFKILAFITILLDATGWYISYIRKAYNNALPYNILLLINVLFFVWIFSLAAPAMKKLCYWLTGIFSLAWLMNFIFLQGMHVYNSYTELTGNIIFSFLSCYFFYALLSQENYVNLLASEYAWLAIGLLLSALGSMLIYLFLDYLQHYHDVTGINLYGYINYTVNVILRSSLIIAFICRRRNTRQTSLSPLSSPQ